MKKEGTEKRVEWKGEKKKKNEIYIYIYTHIYILLREE